MSCSNDQREQVLALSDSAFTYIGKKRDCGCLVAAVSDAGDERTAQAVSNFILGDLYLERVTNKALRQMSFGCRCAPQQIRIEHLGGA